MLLEHMFTVPIDLERVFDILTDVQRVAPCVPGATLDDVRGGEFVGRVKVRVGPAQVTYRGRARLVDVDEDGYQVIINASGTEVRGSGAAHATIRARLEQQDSTTTVALSTDLVINGRLAQFGRGVLTDIGEKLFGQFADCLARELTAGRLAQEVAAPPEPAALAAAQEPPPARAVLTQVTHSDSIPTPLAEAGPADAMTPTAATPTQWPEPAPIDLLELAGGPVIKRLLPVAAVPALVGAAVWVVRRRRD